MGWRENERRTDLISRTAICLMDGPRDSTRFLAPREIPTSRDCRVRQVSCARKNARWSLPRPLFVHPHAGDSQRRTDRTRTKRKS